MILVTGAGGMSGQLIVRELAARNIPVRALVRNAATAPAFDPERVQLVVGDMAKADTLGAALEGVDKALMISSADPMMLETQCAFIDACQASGVPHVVKYSGTELGFRRSAFRFAEMHADAEEYLEQSGLDWTHFRPSGFMQVYLREAPAIVARGELRLPGQGVTLAPVDALDVAKIAVGILLSPDQAGRTHVITGPQALGLDDIASEIAVVAGKPVRYVAISPEQRREDLIAHGAPPYWADALAEQAVERLRNPRAQVRLETHATFGVRPTLFSEFLQRSASAFAAEAA